MDEAKQTSQAKLINTLLAGCQQATACTGIEIIGALEVVKADIIARMQFQARAASMARKPEPAIITPTSN